MEWYCEHCHALNLAMDVECQYCEGCTCDNTNEESVDNHVIAGSLIIIGIYLSVLCR